MDRLLKNEIMVRILVLLISIILWVYVINEQNPFGDKTFNDVPLQVVNLADGLVAVDAPEAVKVQVKGKRSILLGLKSKDITAYIDASGVTEEGAKTLAVKVFAGSNLEVAEVSPAQVTVHFETLKQKQLTVQTNLTGLPAPGYLPNLAQMPVLKATVQGPRSLVDAVDKLIATVDINGASKAVTADVPLTPVDKQGQPLQGLTVIPANVELTVPIELGPPVKTVAVKPNLVGGPGAGLEIKAVVVSPDKVEIKGAPASMQSVVSLETNVINIDGITQDVSLETELQLPPGVELVKPTTVKVTVQVGPASSRRTFENQPVSLRGLAGDLQGSPVPAVVTLEVAGPADLLNALKPGDLAVYVPVGGMGAGSYQLAVKADLPAGISLVRITPAIVTVNLQRI